MQFGTPGSQLLALFAANPKDVIIAAPFIKTAALACALEALDTEQSEVHCVTRWRPEDIAAGVCDLAIFDLMNTLPNGKLWVQPDLHAKYFRADKTCLVGSANLTGRACGWRVPSNLELMVQLPSTFEHLESWEQHLFHSSRIATQEQRDQLEAVASALASLQPTQAAVDVETSEQADENWMPLFPKPEMLFAFYTGTKTEADVSQSNYALAQRDLVTLAPITGLPKDVFNEYVARTLRQLTVIQRVLDASERGVPDRNAPDIIGPFLDPAEQIDSEVAWNTLKKWILHFFPDEFRIESDQEILVRGRTY